MNRSRFAWWPLLRRENRLSREPGAALFWGLRVRLTLWYCGVLGAALVLFGVALYFGTQYFLLSPIEAAAAGHARAHVQQWLTDSPYRGACPLLQSFGPGGQFGPPSGQPFTMSEIVVCYDQNGSLPLSENTAALPSAFINNNLVKSALKTGQPAADIINGGGAFGSIYRYAKVVPDPTGSGYVGVVLVGESVQAQENALALLLKLLLAVGGVALLGAAAGGLFLANRALVPAKLAFTRQQRFIADASHELRTPLTLLRADAEVLLRGRDQLVAEDASLLEDIVAEVSYMSTLATNMLTLARLDAGSMHMERDIISLDEVVTEVIRRAGALAGEKGIEIKVESTGPALVIGDRVLLEQAVLALLDNAIKYNRPGGHVIMRTYENDTQAYLEVQDTGIGIAAEHMPHLGERFYRVDKARSREAGGTGLGLSIARGIAVAHGGTLSLTSIPEQGTTVTLMLPLVNGTATDLLDDAPGSVSSLSTP
jgi:signal transduction histidine kinase